MKPTSVSNVAMNASSRVHSATAFAAWWKEMGVAFTRAHTTKFSVARMTTVNICHNGGTSRPGTKLRTVSEMPIEVKRPNASATTVPNVKPQRVSSYAVAAVSVPR